MGFKKNLWIMFAVLTLAFGCDLYWRYQLEEPLDHFKSLCVICIPTEKVEDYACPVLVKTKGVPVSVGLVSQYILSFTEPLLNEHDVVRIEAVSPKKAKKQLDGLDLKLHRPQVLVVGSIDPVSLKSHHTVWEPMLQAANYVLVLFDGRNRYYFAEEQRERLLRPFMTAGKCACIENKAHHLLVDEIYVNEALVRPSRQR